MMSKLNIVVILCLGIFAANASKHARASGFYSDEANDNALVGFDGLSSDEVGTTTEKTSRCQLPTGCRLVKKCNEYHAKCRHIMCKSVPRMLNANGCGPVTLNMEEPEKYGVHRYNENRTNPMVIAVETYLKSAVGRAKEKIKACQVFTETAPARYSRKYCSDIVKRIMPKGMLRTVKNTVMIQKGEGLPLNMLINYTKMHQSELGLKTKAEIKSFENGLKTYGKRGHWYHPTFLRTLKCDKQYLCTYSLLLVASSASTKTKVDVITIKLSLKLQDILRDIALIERTIVDNDNGNSRSNTIIFQRKQSHRSTISHRYKEYNITDFMTFFDAFAYKKLSEVIGSSRYRSKFSKGVLSSHDEEQSPGNDLEDEYVTAGLASTGASKMVSRNSKVMYLSMFFGSGALVVIAVGLLIYRKRNRHRQDSSYVSVYTEIHNV